MAGFDHDQIDGCAYEGFISHNDAIKYSLNWNMVNQKNLKEN